MSFVPLKNLIPSITTPGTPSNSPSELGRSTPAVSGQALHQSLQHDTGLGVFELFRAAIHEICGDVVSAQIQPLYINNNILVVACLSQAAGDILRLKKKEVLAKVNEQLGEIVIDRIHCLG